MRITIEGTRDEIRELLERLAGAGARIDTSSPPEVVAKGEPTAKCPNGGQVVISGSEEAPPSDPAERRRWFAARRQQAWRDARRDAQRDVTPPVTLPVTPVRHAAVPPARPPAASEYPSVSEGSGEEETPIQPTNPPEPKRCVTLPVTPGVTPERNGGSAGRSGSLDPNSILSMLRDGGFNVGLLGVPEDAWPDVVARCERQGYDESDFATLVRCHRAGGLRKEGYRGAIALYALLGRPGPDGKCPAAALATVLGKSRVWDEKERAKRIEPAPDRVVKHEPAPMAALLAQTTAWQRKHKVK